MRKYWIDLETVGGGMTRLFMETDEHVAFKPGDDEEGDPPTMWIGGLSGTQIEFEDNEVTVKEVLDETGYETREIC